MEKLRSVDAEDSSIFGLKKGMSVSEIRALEFGDVEQGSENDSFFVNNPKMPSGAAYGGFLVSPWELYRIVPKQGKTHLCGRLEFTR